MLEEYLTDRSIRCAAVANRVDLGRVDVGDAASSNASNDIAPRSFDRFGQHDGLVATITGWRNWPAGRVTMST